MNCNRCKKHKKDDELTLVYDGVFNEEPQYLCAKCMNNYQKERGSSGSLVELEMLKDGKLKTLMVCSHCGLKTKDRKYYLEHNCMKFLNTKEFIEKGGLRDLK